MEHQARGISPARRALGRELDVERPAQRQHAADRYAVEKTKCEKLFVTAGNRHCQNAERSRGKDDRRASADRVTDVTKQETAGHGACEANAEDLPHHHLVEMKRGREIRRRKRDDVHVEAIKKSDNPRPGHERNQEAVQFLLLDNLRNVDLLALLHALFPSLSLLFFALYFLVIGVARSTTLAAPSRQQNSEVAACGKHASLTA
jgi:hypothetical protein